MEKVPSLHQNLGHNPVTWTMKAELYLQQMPSVFWNFSFKGISYMYRPNFMQFPKLPNVIFFYHNTMYIGASDNSKRQCSYKIILFR